MLSKAENERLTQVGPGTPMGHVMRHYWIPVVLTSELEAGGKPKRVKLLGERLVAYRSHDGQVGLLGEFCSHRRASLYFGRNEQGCLRCVYHGWQYDREGHCTDMPNVEPENNFQEKVRHTAYPCVEGGGVVWTYMGPADTRPEPPDLEWCGLPESQRLVTKFYQECNYMQALESGIDPSHIAFLHSVVETSDESVHEELDQAAAGFALMARLARAPHIEVEERDYGALLAARRETDEGQYYWRITQYHLPFYTMPPTDPVADPVLHAHIYVPVDDENCINWCISWNPTRDLTKEELTSWRSGLSVHIMEFEEPTSEPYGDIRPLASNRNDFHMDWEAHRTQKFFGVPGVGVQDKAITENQEVIVDRSQEHLSSADVGVIRARKCLLDAATALQNEGTLPPGMDAASFRVRPASLILPKDTPWAEGASEHLIVP